MDEVKLDEAMALAISEATRGAGLVSPNPQVGCVVISAAGKVLATGFHEKFGGPHAEVNAIRQIDPSLLKGARVIVTLEPCAHEGKTPSCAKMLAKLPLAEVIFGLVDPNPLVAGQGAKIIHQAGIHCAEYQGRLKEDLFEVAEQFLVNQQEKRPFLSLKVASSLDGQMALRSGEAKWITGESAREYGHYLRATHEATLVGQRTVEIDNPSLNIRHPQFPDKKNKVIILLSRQRPLSTAQLQLRKAHSDEDLFFLQPEGDGYIRLKPRDDGQLVSAAHPEKFTKNFQRAGSSELLAASILVEGGAAVLSSFIQARQFDRLYLFQAPVIIGAQFGKSWTEQVKTETMENRISLGPTRLLRFGTDVLITARLKLQ